MFLLEIIAIIICISALLWFRKDVFEKTYKPEETHISYMRASIKATVVIIAIGILILSLFMEEDQSSSVINILGIIFNILILVDLWFTKDVYYFLISFNAGEVPSSKQLMIVKGIGTILFGLPLIQILF